DGSDPLGFDQDRDGAISTLDSNDQLPTWIPAMRLSSNNFAQYIDVEFVDLLEVIDQATFKTSDGQTTQDVAVESFGAGKWRVQMPSSPATNLQVTADSGDN